MKYSNTTLRELNAQYRSVLKKCFLFNAAVFVGTVMIVASSAADTIQLGDRYFQTSKLFIANDTEAVLQAGSSVSNNTNLTDGIGGAIYIEKAGGSLVVEENVVFNNNESIYDGGAIGNYGSLTVLNANFTENKAQTSTMDSQAIGGGAISLGIDSFTTITGTTFSDNTSGYSGGAIGTRKTLQNSEVADAETRNSLVISNSLFTGNKALGTLTDTSDSSLLASGNGGAIANTFATVSISDTVFSNNSAVNYGGAIFNMPYENAQSTAFYDVGGKMTLSNTNFDNNSAKFGGAIFNQGQLTVNGVVFNNNRAEDGGAVFNQKTMLIGDGVQFIGNASTNNGGAVYNDKNASLTIGNNATFYDNMLIDNGVNHGSDIYNNGGTVVIGDNLTLSRSEDYTSEHDCAFMNKSGSTMIIGHNALFKNVSEVLITEKGTYSMGDNARFEGVGNGFSNWGGQITLGDNAVFLNGTARALQNANNTAGTITVGANAIFDGNSDLYEVNGGGSVIFNGDKSTMIFGDGFVAQNNRADKGNSVVYNGTNSALTFTGSSTFTNNGTSNKSGVLRNWGTVSFDGTTMFTGNSANSDGGAIFNGDGAIIDFNGDATFFDNSIASGDNDIHNLGIVKINAGTTKISGGITGDTGSLMVAEGATLDIGTASVSQGTATFASGSTLKASLLNSSSYGSLTADTISADGANLFLTVGAAGEYTILTGAGADSFNVATQDVASLFALEKTFNEQTNTLTYIATQKTAD